jgi:hypothetical protein
LIGPIDEEDLAYEAQKVRYRVNVVYGSRSLKRDRETATEEREGKKIRRDVIELSSDGEEDTRALPLQDNKAASDSQKIDKGKGTEFAPVLDFQDELECFICCTPFIR